MGSEMCIRDSITGENIQCNGGLTLRGNPQARDVGAAIAAASKASS